MNNTVISFIKEEEYKQAFCKVFKHIVGHKIVRIFKFTYLIY